MSKLKEESSEHAVRREPKARNKRRILTEDVFSIKSVGDAQISEDGSAVAFVIADGYREGTKRARANIWLAELDEDGRQVGKPRQFTSGRGADVYPKWSPRGDKLAFLSDRADGEKFQVYVMDRKGGEAVQLTNLSGEIGTSVFTPLPQTIAWSPDGRKIAFLMWDPLTPQEAEVKKRRGDVLEFEKDHKYCQIWTVDIGTKEVRRRSDGSHQVWEFDWSRDGKRFAAIVSSEPYEWSWYEAKLAVISAQTGETEIVHDPHPRQIAKPFWSMDGTTLYFISSVLSDRNVVAGDLFSIRADGQGGAADLVKGYQGSVSWMEWISPTQLLFTGIEGLRTVFCTLDVSKSNRATGLRRRSRIWSGEVTLATSYWRRFSLSRRTGRIAVGREDLESPTETWVGRIVPKMDESQMGVEWTQLTEINAHVRDWDSGEIKPLEWDSTYAGRTIKIQGFLMLPTESKKGKKTPLVVIAHGGPTQCNGYRYYFLNAYGTHLMAANGFAVLLPNPRGSYGRGLRFAEANVGDMGGGDFSDIMAGVDHCLAMGIFDPKRVYIMGGSYGGYLTAWAVTQTDRFRAAIMQWGISNWLSFHGTSAVPLWDSGQYRTDPYGPDSLQHKFSPITHVKRVRTPTLIVNGGDDTACPPSQSHEFFRALKERGVETELVIYPGEGHGLTQRAHVVDALNRYLDWFKKH